MRGGESNKALGEDNSAPSGSSAAPPPRATGTGGAEPSKVGDDAGGVCGPKHRAYPAVTAQELDRQMATETSSKRRGRIHTRCGPQKASLSQWSVADPTLPRVSHTWGVRVWGGGGMGQGWGVLCHLPGLPHLGGERAQRRGGHPGRHAVLPGPRH